MARETKELHVFECSMCGDAFESRDRNQLASARKGHRVFCTVKCRTRHVNRQRESRYECGPCPTCGNMFRTRSPDRKFCTLDCYTQSPGLLERLAAANALKAKEWKCHLCGKDVPRRKTKFCNDFCRREFFASRFDRFIANPEELALPQNYDEFLNRDELPCLIEGCSWVGVGLSQHVNWIHGIPPDKFKELAGFNATTALMGLAGRKKRSEIMHELIAKGVIVPGRADVLATAKPSRHTNRLEGREHYAKAMANGGASLRDAAVAAAARTPEARKRVSARMKAWYAKAKTIELVCQECENPFETKEYNRDRSRHCSVKCSNAFYRRRRKQREAEAAE
jgi:hypothetical protein